MEKEESGFDLFTKRAKRNNEKQGKAPTPVAETKKRADSSPKRKTPTKQVKKESKKETKKETKKPAAEKKAPPKKKKDDDEDEDFDVEGIEDGDEEDLMDEEEAKDEDDEEEFGTAPSKKKAGRPSKGKEEKKEKSAPKKGGKKLSKEEGTDAVIEYLSKMNRPYSLLNIFDNLHGSIKKADLQRILDRLTEEGTVQMKEYGKAKIYLINQAKIPQVNPAEMEKLKLEMNEARDRNTKLNEEIKSLQAALKDLLAQPTEEELENEILNYECLIAEADDKLRIYEEGSYTKVSDLEIQQAEDKKKKFETEFRKRRRLCMNMLDSISEGTGQKISELMETIGIDNQL